MPSTAGEGFTPKAPGQARDSWVGSGGLPRPFRFKLSPGKQAWARTRGFTGSESCFCLQLLRRCPVAALTRTQG